MKRSYLIARDLYLSMPPQIQNALRGPAHGVAKFWRRSSLSDINNGKLRHMKNGHADLEWGQFQAQILSHRDDYTGVFIQGAIIDWDVDLYQRPQHLASAFAKRDYLVIYQTHNWANDDVQGFRQVKKNVWLTNFDVAKQISDAVISVYSTGYIGDVMKNAYDKNTIVYEYIDHIDPKISGDPENIKKLSSLKDFAFSGGADYVVASSAALYKEAIDAVGQGKVIMVQNGVDTKHYRCGDHQTTKTTDEYKCFRQKYKKVVGYFGALAPWIWYDEINKLVLSRPDLGFIFIGPDYYGGRSKLIQSENIFCPGPIDYKILPAYAREFDICFIPFEPGEIARTTSPLKLFEYFALEKPVVVTSFMDECVIYPEVFSGRDAAELSTKIDEALNVSKDPAFKTRLAELADRNSWDQRAAAYEKVFEGLKRLK
ncbi:glycosyltransferase [Ochrobactrum sp. CGA5]|uniref:glycosyltransferase n=1 Tax=Ochrobactrum sp. CGA5 TaxID=2583453 RepID=UPI0020000C55|nr:glycosyltransferase [Ochrobactrum sp. CGA5]